MLTMIEDVKKHRRPGHSVSAIFLQRWSPRAMSGQPLSREDLFSLLEAARWAPSSSNNQPWRFIYAFRESPAWNVLFDLLVDRNKSWVKNAGALILIASKKTFENGKPCRTHSFDTGSAWMSLALQGSMTGLVVHGMEGFDYDRAAQVLKVPETYQVEAMAAVGHPGRKEDLPETVRAREFPSNRQPVEAFAFEGSFPPS